MHKNVKDLTGIVFDRLTVIERVENNKHGGAVWLCECVCGNIKPIWSANLLGGGTISCGCFSKEKARERIIKISQEIHTLEPGVAYSNYLYSNYKNSASRRNIDFLLTLEEFIKLITKSCYYCGIPPWEKESKIIETFNGIFPINGIDRVDSYLGYILDNCVSCCKVCNQAKSNMSYDEFIEWIHCVYINLTSTPELAGI